MDSSFPATAPVAWTQALDRHQLRRTQGILTLSVLAGDPALALALWRQWTGAVGYPCVVGDASHVGEESDAGDSSATVRLIVFPGEASMAAELAVTMRQLCLELEKFGSAQEATILALSVETAVAQAYLRAAPDSRAKAIFREGLILLDSAATPPNLGDQKYGQDGSPVDDGTRPGPTSAFFEEFARAHSTLAQQRASPQTMASFRAAAAGLRELRATAPPASGAVAISGAKAATADQARSAAEQFLFDLLGDLPETAGLFALNVKLDFCFGPMAAEVDLLAAGLRLAVEIDGYYHFRDADGYRRDRRKDTLLQKQGYLVLRFLADDVVARLEDILQDIRAAVAFRRVTAGG